MKTELCSLAGQTAIITGRACGVGKATAESFVSAGANLLIADLNEAGADELSGKGADVKSKLIVNPPALPVVGEPPPKISQK